MFELRSEDTKEFKEMQKEYKIGYGVSWHGLHKMDMLHTPQRWIMLHNAPFCKVPFLNLSFRKLTEMTRDVPPTTLHHEPGRTKQRLKRHVRTARTIEQQTSSSNQVTQHSFEDPQKSHHANSALCCGTGWELCQERLSELLALLSAALGTREVTRLTRSRGVIPRTAYRLQHFMI